jgi:hypothetical protein
MIKLRGAKYARMEERRGMHLEIGWESQRERRDH